MKISDLVRLAIDNWERRELDLSMLLACIAADGTARKQFPQLRNKQRFTRLLRENYAILGPMGMPGVDLVGTRFPVRVQDPTTSDGKPDVADVLYGIHRCCHAHGEDLPDGFELVPNAHGPKRIAEMVVVPGHVRFSDRMIFALLAISVLSPENKEETIPGDKRYYLTYGSLPELWINEWWGRASDFPRIVAQDLPPQVALNLCNRMV